MSNNDDVYARALPVFAVAFALIYLAAEQMNWPLFTHHPRVGDWEWLRKPPRAPNAPAMHWYGWLATSAIGATLVSLASLPLTKGRQLPSWIGWAIPLAVMVLFVYLFRSFFLR